MANGDAPTTDPQMMGTPSLGTQETMPTAPAVPAAAPQLAPAATPQAPAAPPVPAAAVVPEAKQAPGEHFRNLSHALQGAILSTLAVGRRGFGKLIGPDHIVDSYNVDETGKMTPNIRQLHTGDRLQLMAHAALEGLAAGSRVPSGPNRAAQWAAGIGQGFEAQRAQAQRQDLLKRQQGQEEFEQKQKATMNRATIAMHNAAVYRDYMDSLNKAWDRNPEYANGQAVKDAIDEYNGEFPNNKITYEVLTPEAAQARFMPTTVGQAAHAPDAHPITNQIILPLRPIVATDAKGQPLKNDDGSPQTQGQVLAISGTGTIPLPAAYIQDLQRYKDLIPGVMELQPNQGLTPIQFAHLNALRYQAKQQALDPKNSSYSKTDDGWVRVNAITHESTPIEEKDVPQSARATEAEIDLKESEAEQKRAAAEALRQQLGSGPYSSAIKLVEGYEGITQLSKRAKDYQARIDAADAYSMQKYGQHFDAVKSETDFAYAKNIQTQNTLKMIDAMIKTDTPLLKVVMDQAMKLPRMDSQLANQVFNTAKTQFGDAALTNFQNSMLALADVYSKVMTGGVSTDTGRQQALDLLKSEYSSNQFKGGVAVLRQDLAARRQSTIGNNVYLRRNFGIDPPAGAQTGTMPDGSKVYTLDKGKTVYDLITGLRIIGTPTPPPVPPIQITP